MRRGSEGVEREGLCTLPWTQGSKSFLNFKRREPENGGEHELRPENLARSGHSSLVSGLVGSRNRAPFHGCPPRRIGLSNHSGVCKSQVRRGQALGDTLSTHWSGVLGMAGSST